VTGWRWLALLLILPACSSWWAAAPVDRPPADDSERIVRRAEAEAQAGAYPEAARLFSAVINGSNGAFTDRALLGLTRVLVYPEYPGRDYAQAYALTERLQREYPHSPYVAEARAWRDLLGAYLTRNEELSRLARELDQNARELERRARELERLQQVDQELERRTQELQLRTQALQLRTQELERQKRLDQELERLTHELALELERRTQELQRLKSLDLQLEKPKTKP
jgi:hypothetical protein